MYVANAQAKAFTSTMTYEILLIVVVGGIGSVSGSVIATFLYVACSEWWLRFLDSEIVLKNGFKVPLQKRLQNGGLLDRHHGHRTVFLSGYYGRPGDQYRRPVFGEQT